VIQTFEEKLRPGGHLLLGHSESLINIRAARAAPLQVRPRLPQADPGHAAPRPVAHRRDARDRRRGAIAMSAPIRALVIDDSAFSRQAITRMLQESPLVEVIGVARDGEEALRKTLELQPT
jgi:hypothetical protein